MFTELVIPGCCKTKERVFGSRRYCPCEVLATADPPPFRPTFLPSLNNPASLAYYEHRFAFHSKDSRKHRTAATFIDIFNTNLPRERKLQLPERRASGYYTCTPLITRRSASALKISNYLKGCAWLRSKGHAQDVYSCSKPGVLSILPKFSVQLVEMHMVRADQTEIFRYKWTTFMG